MAVLKFVAAAEGRRVKVGGSWQLKVEENVARGGVCVEEVRGWEDICIKLCYVYVYGIKKNKKIIHQSRESIFHRACVFINQNF